MSLPVKGIDYQAVLNPAQYEAVTTIEGPVLVIAGAGSGKTRTLVYRTAYLVEQGIPPESILLLTFTRKAATEMISRASELLDERCHLVAGGTFHSTGNQILRRHGECIGYGNGFTIMDQGDSADALALLAGRLGLKGSGKRFPKKGTVQSIFSKMVNRSLDLEQVLEDDYSQFLDFQEDLWQLHLAYQQYKVEQRLMDYDDLLRNWWKLLLEWPEVCKLLAETYQYIMVDEYQDTNKLQAEIVRLLASQRPNVMVVGDDSQSIYSFRGADFKNIMEFPKLFPGARLIKLEQNYRSTQPILNFTNELIAQAHEHYTKCLFSERESANLPSVVSASKDKDQSLFVVQTIRQFQARGLDLGEMAVLFRASFHSYDLEVELARAGIPFVKYGGLRFAETAHLKDVMAHLRVAHNPLDAVSWHRLLLLIDGIGARTAERLIQWLMQNGPSAAGIRSFIAQQKKAAWVSNLQPLAALMEEISRPELNMLELVEAVCRYYEPLAVRHYDDYPKRLKDLTFLEGWAEQYSSLAAMLTDLALEPPDFYGQRKGHREEGTLTLSTIHSAKGLEWRVVFIISVAEGRFPSPYAAYRDNDLEEERRLLYVAATRARDFLVITHANMYGGAGNEGYGVYAGGPSPFLLNISAHHLKRLNAATFSLERLEQGAQASHGPTHAEKSAEVAGFAPGRRVDHPTFGRGVILGIKENRITVAFENHGSKTLDGRHAPLRLPDH